MKPELLWEESNISVFSFPLVSEPEAISNYAFVLTGHEQAQADSFRSRDQRAKAIVRRGALRQLLGDHLGRDPSTLEFEVARYGKPTVKDHSVHFSASSSGDIGLIAISQCMPVGVDVELHDHMMISDKFDSFSEFEHDLVRNAADKADFFFRIWTRKEACVKATGHGMAYSLGSLEVMPDRSPRCLVDIFDEQVVAQDLVAPTGYSMAVAWKI